jgi:hypothetical protein
MFIYFIQRKGFLDGDRDYLRSRLQRTRAEHGKDKFFSFYRYFLLRLFHEGLGGRKRSAALDKLVGRIPYLNGGLFDVHELERPDRYGAAIEIPDSAFMRIFDYFDQYQWHLDERPLKSDNEINPDVLGHIFEKYINQKQMGAYYTKEDITEYIGKNTLLPFLIDAAREKCRIAFENKNGSTVWQLLSDDPDRYVYEAGRFGSDQALPPEISRVLDAKVGAIARDKRLGGSATRDVGLPTEIWLETVGRRRRHEEIRHKLTSGEIHTVEDMLLLNLDLRQFAQDIIENSEGPELVRSFWHAIQQVSVLDPTCGSGAFLFAVLNILEPLYEACLARMEAFVVDADSSTAQGGTEKFIDFRDMLKRVSAHPNRRYFIFKSIILNNLYGVDIMEEAVEICKLRLFLKLAAQVSPDKNSPNLGIEPLPDIDFNIRAGNSLVGYADLQEVRRAVGSKLDFENALSKITDRAAKFQEAFDAFRKHQTAGDGSGAGEYKAALREQLDGLEAELNKYLANDDGVKVTQAPAYGAWLKSHHPFHWFIEFYGIMSKGGFDVIVGNPPYVEIPKNLSRSLLRGAFKSALDRWSRDEDLYTLVVERSLALLKRSTGQFGMILPLSVSFSTKKPFIALRKALAEQAGLWLWSHFDRIPSALFGSEVRTRCTIAVLSRSEARKNARRATTSLLRWNAEYRSCLFANLAYAELHVDIAPGIPKVASQLQADVLRRLLQRNLPLGLDLTRPVSFSELESVAPRFPQPAVYVGGTAYNWFPAWRDIPQTNKPNGDASLPARTAGYRFDTDEDANIIFALLCSSLGYWWWAVASDAFNLKRWLLERFPLSRATIPGNARGELARLGVDLREALKRNYVFKDNKGRIGNFYLPACGEQIQAIDNYLARSVPGLSAEFFDDIAGFNSCFSRAEVSETEQDESRDEG